MQIEKCGTDQLPQWVALRIALWPDEDAQQIAAEAPAMLAQADLLVLVAREGKAVIGFAEAAIRNDYVNGCETSPVAFVEGIYVEPQRRRRGVAKAMSRQLKSGQSNEVCMNWRRTRCWTMCNPMPCMKRWVLPKPNAWSISAKC